MISTIKNWMISPLIAGRRQFDQKPMLSLACFSSCLHTEESVYASLNFQVGAVATQQSIIFLASNFNENWSENSDGENSNMHLVSPFFLLCKLQSSAMEFQGNGNEANEQIFYHSVSISVVLLGSSSHLKVGF